MIKIEDLSKKFQVKKLTPSDASTVLNLANSNSSYYNFCPPRPTRHSILEDINVVPADKTQDDKYFVGFYQDNKLIAILDMIMKYPDEITAWIGFFMVNADNQKKGVGSLIMGELLPILKQSGLKQVELAYPKGNSISEKFLKKNKFEKTGQEISVPGYTVVVMKQNL
ncbi:GNAT family N-acetyltransferase [Companilactobacillus halodurans]|uniref:GNAT family N-acetyltransferase n=1 Tax=Companilactobacillus halodurans TaxID=2584183 RepID=A0A5P0ZP95_9LACO|nr:GNAT family N-acetyltransferase [Companilactobacillus halodurans]MQS75681.1 GNAT family N-acetyltransferase [Companilactobacillus halodurans]MQS97671.1 GNAT family N-acetyltransferase [Companilactobacillus halodurans]